MEQTSPVATMKRPPHGKPQHRKRKRGKQEEQSPTPKACSVCKTGEPKYKCPKCFSTYCSIACCSRHKAEFCENILAEAMKSNESEPTCAPTPSKFIPNPTSLSELVQSTAALPARSAGDLDDGCGDNSNGKSPCWKLSPDMKEKLDACSWIQQQLQDPGLRALIAHVVRTPYHEAATPGRRRGGGGRAQQYPISQRELVLQKLRNQYPQFSRFIDGALVVSGVLGREDDRTPLEEWLQHQGSGDGNVGDLTLK